MMKKRFSKERATSFLLFSCIVLLSLLFSASAAFPMSPEPKILMATGQLKAAERTVVGGEAIWQITLNVNGEEFLGLPQKDCAYFGDAKKPLSAEDFFRKYMGRIITVDLLAPDVILECRVGGE